MYFRHTEVAAASAAAVAPSELTRRQFLRLTTLAGSGLTLGILMPGCGTGPGGAGSSAGLRNSGDVLASRRWRDWLQSMSF